MAFWLRSLLILFALILSGGPLLAAHVRREQRDYDAAVAAFETGDYARAQADFAEFAQKFPESTNVPAAVLLEAQAEFKQGDFTNSVALLADHLPGAGNEADQYVYWMGEGQFAQSNFLAAADIFGSVAQSYPDSALRLRATVEQGAALAWDKRWPAVISLLEQTNGVFQRAAALDPNNDLVSRGRQLEAQGLFIETNYMRAEAVLGAINPQILPPDLYAGLERLQYQVNLATSNFPAAMAAATNLYQAAKISGDITNQCDSTMMRANVLEKMNDIGGAIAAYSENLTNGSPAECQQQAISQITRLALETGRFSQAENNLDNYLTSPANAPPAAEVARLSLGELQLKDYSTRPAETNLLWAAHANFDGFISTFTNSPLLGEAHLNRGWCFWLEKNFSESLDDFQAAAALLPPSENLAVAIFKTGDAEFANTNYTAAITNYDAVLNGFSDYPAVKKELDEPALYQILRASLELTNVTDAGNAMARILKDYPQGKLVSGSRLLYGENLAQSGRFAEARRQFQRFEEEFAGSPLLPQVEFAIGRSYELEDDWTNAMVCYEDWLKNFPANNFRSQAMYALALDNSKAGNETDAFALFSNFVVKFPASDLAPEAQWWMADYFYRQGGTNYVEAEKNYEYVYQNFPTNDLADDAEFMAGCSAAAREDYSEAINDYFGKLEANTNCPEPLLERVYLAHGKALMQMPSSDTNNPLANYQSARGAFSQVCLRNPTNEMSALAWFYTGDCDLQLTNYDAATNDYAQAFNTNMAATVSTRSMAQVALATALEKEAALAAGADRTALLQAALNNYLDVYETAFGKNLRDDETADPFWIKEAFLQALPLIKTLGAGDPNKFVDQMEQLLPQLRDSLEKIRASLPAQKS